VNPVSEHIKEFKMNNVFDVKTGKALFNTTTRDKLQEGLKPYFREDSTEASRTQAVNTIEQVLCLSLVAGARSLGEVLAEKLIGLFTGKKEVSTTDTQPEAPSV
jgi:hypothetical protein